MGPRGVFNRLRIELRAPASAPCALPLRPNELAIKQAITPCGRPRAPPAHSPCARMNWPSNKPSHPAGARERTLRAPPAPKCGPLARGCLRLFAAAAACVLPFRVLVFPRCRAFCLFRHLRCLAARCGCRRIAAPRSSPLRGPLLRACRPRGPPPRGRSRVGPPPLRALGCRAAFGLRPRATAGAASVPLRGPFGTAVVGLRPPFFIGYRVQRRFFFFFKKNTRAQALGAASFPKGPLPRFFRKKEKKSNPIR